MNEPPSPTVGTMTVEVVAADEQDAVGVDVERWSRLARDVLVDEGRVGELTLTFVDADEIAALNQEHLGKAGPTDVLSFPLDGAVLDAAAEAPGGAGVPDRGVASERRAPQTLNSGAVGPPLLLGDVVVCPEVAAAQAADHAGTIDDELALLVVHGVLHVLGHDHAEPDETALMRERELRHLMNHHWHGPAPAGFRHGPAEDEDPS